MQEPTDLSKRIPTDFEPQSEGFPRPIYTTTFVDVSQAAGKFISAIPTNDLHALTTKLGIDLSQNSCLFAIPNQEQSSHEPRRVGISGIPSRILTLHIEHGCGRGISEVARMPQYVDASGLTYSRIIAKGNGPTANEGYRLAHDEDRNAYRLFDPSNPFGLLFTDTAETIEAPTLERLATLGFRVGKVVGYFPLNPLELARLIDPFYHEARSPYQVRKELSKAQGRTPCIMIRLSGGPKIELLNFHQTQLSVLKEAVLNLAAEIRAATQAKVVQNKTEKSFCQKYRIPSKLQPFVDQLGEFQESSKLNASSLFAYIQIICFLIWRNYHLQNEYNRRFPIDGAQLVKFAQRRRVDTSSEIIDSGEIGPIWMNYKPGDIDISGYAFDADVFHIKLALALKHGASVVRASDYRAITDGLTYFEHKIGQSLPHLPIARVSQAMYTISQEISDHIGFLGDDAEEQDFYTLKQI